VQLLSDTPIRLGQLGLKISSEFRFPVSSTSRVVHVGFLASLVMAQARSVSTHRFEADFVSGCISGFRP
jgi:hypothetical protein